MLLSYSAAIAQDGLPQNAPTPTATSLGRYGDIPVSYYTGNPGISIPLYTMNSRGLEMPISLTYDASGIQLNALPGWVGHSWTLQVGGVITRQTNGRDDEVTFTQDLMSQKHCYFQSHTYLYDCVHSQNGMNPSLLLSNSYTDIYDVSPDVYTFNFMGRTGKFFLDHNGQWRVFSEYNLEIINDIDDDNLLPSFITRAPDPLHVLYLPHTISGFKIRDDNGYTYVFGYNQNAIEYSTDFFRMTSKERIEYWHATSWYLTAVYDKYGNQLYTLTYERGKFIAQLYNHSYNKEYNEQEDMYMSWLWNPSFHNYSLQNATNMLSGQLHAPVYLKSISGGNSMITFNSEANPNLKCDLLYPNHYRSNLEMYVRYPDTDHSGVTAFYYLETNCDSIMQYQYNSSHKVENNPLANACISSLNSMIIHSINGQSESMTYSFQYDFSSRMHLTQVKQYCANQDIKTYTFNYNNYNDLPSSYLTTAIDHWGYYNGRLTSIEDFGTSSIQEYEFSRRPDSSYSQYGMLTQITYPTGGVSRIEYEPNTFSKYIDKSRYSVRDSIGIGGGIRVKSITEYEDNSLNVILKSRTFSYNIPNTNQSSGELFAAPCYSWINWKLKSGNTYYTYSTFRTSSIVPLANSFGPSIGYSYVQETNGDGAKTVYHYLNMSSAMDKRPFMVFSDNISSPFDKFTERGYKRGKILDISMYDSSNNKVSKISYEYRSDNTDTDSVLICNISTLGSGVNNYIYLGGVYNLLYPRFYVTKKTETIYNENESITTVTDYAYNYNRNTLVQYINMNGQTKTHYVNTTLLQNECTVRNSQSSMKVYSYSSAYSNDKYADLKSKYHDLRPSSVLEYVNNYNVLTTSTVFRYITANGRQVPVPAYTLAKYNGGSAQDSLYVYDDYTSTGTLKEYHQKDGQHVYLGYAYNDNYLVWKGIGTLTAPISFTESNIFDPDALYTQLRGNYTGQNDDLMLTVYSYYPLFGIKSITEPNGYITYYDVEHGFLRNIIDNRQRTLQHFDYNYRIR